MFFCLVISICLSTATVFSQTKAKPESNEKYQAVTTLRVGSALSGTSRIQPGTAQFILYTVLPNGNRRFISILTRTVEIGEQGGKPIFRVTQRYDGKEKPNTDVSVLNRRTLEPLTYQSELPDQKESFTFTPQTVQGVITPVAGEPKNIAESLKEPVFNAVADLELIQSLPLTAEYAVFIKSYNPGKAFLDRTYRVTRAEQLKMANGGEIETWVLETRGVTYWISKKTQELITMKVQLNDGSQFWKTRLYSGN